MYVIMHTLSVGVIYSGWQDFPLRVSFILRWFYKSTQVVCAVVRTVSRSV